METKTKETKKVLKKVFMVGHSDCSFGEEVIQEVSLFGKLECKSQQLLSFIGDRHFDTELEAIEHIKTLGEVACVIQEVFIWKLIK